LLVSYALRTLLNLLLEHALLIKDVTFSQLLKGILFLFFLVILILIVDCKYRLLFVGLFLVAQLSRWLILPVNDFFVPATFSFTDNALIKHVNFT